MRGRGAIAVNVHAFKRNEKRRTIGGNDKMMVDSMQGEVQAPLLIKRRTKERLVLGNERVEEGVVLDVEVSDLACSAAPLGGHHGLTVGEIEHFFALASTSSAMASTIVVLILWRYHVVKRRDHACFSKGRGGTGRIRREEGHGEQESERHRVRRNRGDKD